MGVCEGLMPAFEKVKDAGFSADGSVNCYTNDCLKAVIEKKGISDSLLQRHIEIFLKYCEEDEYSPIPGNKFFLMRF